ncbi:MAG: aminoacyl-tRNA hydrolase [Calditrichaeota bacterium]|nr:aminoacyl-tRNA hydrolase [Calditrichota bacterium]MCB9366851.1 aminoacyl-tRNA hydrolase [Calditrichota bacterium]
MRLVVGLGNPGTEYDDTPHNIGFAVCEELARRAGVSFKRGPVAETASAALPGRDVTLLLPLAYMNLSGRPVTAAMRWHKLESKSLIVVCDDVNLPEGKLRIRSGGGAGGQKGLRSIIETIGTEDIPRLRLGVGGGVPGADVGYWVLRKLRGKPLEAYRELASLGADAIEHWLEFGLDAAMNRYNASSEI